MGGGGQEHLSEECVCGRTARGGLEGGGPQVQRADALRGRARVSNTIFRDSYSQCRSRCQYLLVIGINTNCTKNTDYFVRAKQKSLKNLCVLPDNILHLCQI